VRPSVDANLTWAKLGVTKVGELEARTSDSSKYGQTSREKDDPSGTATETRHVSDKYS
jgi:hypothetical protein